MEVVGGVFLAKKASNRCWLRRWVKGLLYFFFFFFFLSIVPQFLFCSLWFTANMKLPMVIEMLKEEVLLPKSSFVNFKHSFRNNSSSIFMLDI